MDSYITLLAKGGNYHDGPRTLQNDVPLRKGPNEKIQPDTPEVYCKRIARYFYHMLHRKDRKLGIHILC
jgi:hypothetical protein